jgi:hypothetical protein
MKYIGLVVDRGIRVFELELELGRDTDGCGDDLIDMFLGVVVYWGVTTWYYPSSEEREGNMSRIITKEVASRPLNIWFR